MYLQTVAKRVILVVLFFPLCLLSLKAQAQEAPIAPDGTTPTDVSQLGNVSEISGGDRIGDNLFHSFRDFSVLTGNEAAFNNGADINNIISRVTGGRVSDLDGLIRANGSANLFLINPAGIIFGANARLDIGGSFLASTADSLIFSEGEFSATNLEKPPLLIINAPIGLQLRENAAAIEVRGANLDVTPNQNLALVGGNVGLNGAILSASDGRIELGGLAEEGVVGLNFAPSNFSLNFPEFIARADVSLLDRSIVDVTNTGIGSIAINSRNLTIARRSEVFAGTLRDLGVQDIQPGSININATETVTINSNSRLANLVNPRGVGNSGNINIIAESLNLIDDSRIDATVFGRGNAGDLKIETGSLVLDNNSRINTGIRGEGNAGDISIQARDAVSVRERSVIISSILPGGIGNAGNVDLQARSLSLTNGSQIQSAILPSQGDRPGGKGRGGNIRVTTAESFNVSGIGSNGFASGLTTSTEVGAIGDAGDITVSTGNLLITDGGFSANTRNASNGGSIAIEANNLEIVNGGQIAVISSSSGNAGNIFINVKDKVTVAGSDPNYFERLNRFGTNVVGDTGAESGFLAGTTKTSTGKSGDLIIDSTELNISDGARIAVSNEGTGSAGDLAVISEAIALDRGTIAANTTGGEQGNIVLRSPEIELRNGSIIETNAIGDASGGNIVISSFDPQDFNDFVLLKDESKITSNAIEGNGGIIAIATKGIFQCPQCQIEATSRFGTNGIISIYTPEVNSSQTEIQTPENIVVPEETVAQACSGNVGGSTNSFTILGRGGLPASPTQPLNSSTIRVGKADRDRTEKPQVNSKIKIHSENIVPARGMMINARGQTVLTAYPTDGSDRRYINPKPQCLSRSNAKHTALKTNERDRHGYIFTNFVSSFN